MLQISVKEIPKCLICNEIASGVHYGVITCEGCKGFFRRAITSNACEESNLICYGTPKYKCNIIYRIRHVCQRCRLQKCFNVGMTRKHSKLGRKKKLHVDVTQAPHNSTFDNILNDIEFKEKIKQENKYFHREISIFSNEDSDRIKITDMEPVNVKINNMFTKEPRLPDFETDKDTKKVYCNNISSLRVSHHQDAMLSSILHSHWSSSSINSNNEMTSSFQDGQSNNSKFSLESTNSNLFPLGFSLIRISDSEADHLFVQMNDFIHLKSRTDPNFMLFQKYRKLIPQAHMETCILTIPIMENFFDNKYQNVMVDNDPESVWNIMLQEMESTTRRIVLFCNKLPDFKSALPLADSISVIKWTLFDIISIRYLRIVDWDRNQIFDPRLTRKIPIEVLAKVPLGPLFLRYFCVVEFIRKELIDSIDDYEMAYLSALCLTLPGWDNSQIKIINAGHLNKLKFFYCLCLYDHLLVRRYKGNTFETRKRMRRLYALLDKIKFVSRSQSDIIMAINEKENFVDRFQLIFKQI